jgi:hypothetical protein
MTIITEDQKPSGRGKRARTKRGVLPATQVEVAQATQVETEATPIEAAPGEGAGATSATPPGTVTITEPVSEPVLWPALLPFAIPLAGVAFVAAASQRLAQGLHMERVRHRRPAPGAEGLIP